MMVSIMMQKTGDDGLVAYYRVESSIWSGDLRYLYRADQWQSSPPSIPTEIREFLAARLQEEQAWNGHRGLPTDLSGFIEMR